MSTNRKHYPVLTHQEAKDLIQELNEKFEIARLVDVGKQREITFDYSGRHMNMTELCFAVWNKNSRCKNCTSSVAYRKKTRLTKYEFVGDTVYHVTSQYIEVDHSPCLLEVVERVDETSKDRLFGSASFIGEIQRYEHEIYTDHLTGVNNRRYYEEQLRELNMSASVIVQIKELSKLTAEYGSVCHDRILQCVAEAIQQKIRNEDSLVRYDEDRFLIVFADLKEEFLKQKLQRIEDAVKQICLEEYPEIQLSVQIGGGVSEGLIRPTG